MKLSIKPAFAAFSAFIFSVSIQAALVTYSFSGTVSHDFTPVFGTLYQPVGASITGKITYNPESWSIVNIGTSTKWNSLGYDHGISFNIGGTTYTPSTRSEVIHQIQIGNNEDKFSYVSVNPSDPLTTEKPYTMFINIVGNDQVQDISDPLFLPAGFLHNGRMIEYEDSSQSNAIGDVFFTVDSISQVPIPGAAWLFLSAVGGLIGLKRQFS